MPRKKGPVAELATQPDVFDEVLAAAQQTPPVEPPPAPTEQAAHIIQQVADSTHYPADTPRPTNHAHAVRREPRPGFIDPFAIATDVLAGVRLMESRRFGKMLLAFDEKPSGDVIAKLHEAKFRWEPREKVWTKEIGDNPLSTRIAAEDTFRDVSKQIRTERNISHGIGLTA